MSKLELGVELFLYLAVTPIAISVLLVREEGKIQKHVYHISKIFHDVETKYMRLEIFTFTLIIFAKKLQPYFQAYSITLITDQSMKAILHPPDTLGRIAKWMLELSEFDLKFHLRPSIKV